MISVGRMEGFDGHRPAQAFEVEVGASHLYCIGTTQEAQSHQGYTGMPALRSVDLCHSQKSFSDRCVCKVDELSGTGRNPAIQAQLSWWSCPFSPREMLILLQFLGDISSEEQVWHFPSTSTFQRMVPRVGSPVLCGSVP